MAESAVLREFLVKLGFEVDEAGMKRFTTSVGTMTGNVLKLGAALEGAALAVLAGTTVFASRMSDLYYASQRTGASATNIMAFRFALGQMGGTAQMASNILENLASFMRSSPGASNFMKGMGVETLDPATGKMRDMVDIADDLGAAFNKMPFYIAKARAAMMGIGEQELLVLERGGLREAQDAAKARMASLGLDPDAVAAAGKEYTERINEIKAQFSYLGDVVGAALMKEIQPQLNAFSLWFSQNGPRITDSIGKLTTVLLAFSEWLLPILMDMLDWLVKLDDATGGWSTRLLLLAAAFKFLGLGSVITSFISLGGAIGTAAAAGTALQLALEGAALAWSGLVGYKIGTWISDNFISGTKLGDAIGSIGNHVMAALGSTEAQASVDQLDPHARLIKRAMDKGGLTRAQAVGLVSNFADESGLRPDAVGDGGKAYGLGQWHPDRQADFAAWAKHPMKGSSADEQLDFALFELTQGKERAAGDALRRTQNQAEAAYVVSLQYERPAAGAAEARRRAASAFDPLARAPTAPPPLGVGYGAPGGAAQAPGADAAGAAPVTINQHTEIHIDGAGDPDAVAKAAGREQDAVNARLQRNMDNRAR